MKVASIAVTCCFVLVMLVSSITIVFAFANYKIVATAGALTVAEIHDYLHESTGREVSKSDVDQRRAMLADSSVLIHGNSLESTTVLFLLNVFSLTFVSLGMYLLSRGQHQIVAMEQWSAGMVNVVTDSAKVAALVQQLTTMSTWISMARGTRGGALALYVPVLREVSLRPVETLRELATSDVGFCQEQKLNFDDMLADMRGGLDNLREGAGANKGLVTVVELIDARLDDIGRMLAGTDFVARYRGRITDARKVA